MWKNATFYLILASLGLNLAFVGVWAAHAWAARAANQPQPEPAVWCPLHRALEVTPQQWTEIEPRLRRFQATVGELCSRTDAIRSEVIDAIAADEPDLDAIRAKQEEVLATKRQIQQLVVEHLLAEKELLTPQQQRQLFTMLRERTNCTADPPLSGRSRGRVPPPRDATLPDGAERKLAPPDPETR